MREISVVIKHNIKKAPKTGQWRSMRPEVIRDKCIGCGTCVKFCPEACIVMERGAHNTERKNPEDTGSTIRDPRCASIDYDWCKGCGVCANVCPAKAILMKKE